MNLNLKTMEGIKYLTDEENKKKYVQIDLEKYGEIWEEFYDGLLAQLAQDDEYVSLEEFTKELKSKGLIDG